MSQLPRSLHLAMTSPDHYEVCYSINPWMRPDAWAADRQAAALRARSAWHALADRARALGMTVHVIPAAPGLPDLVFPANAAIVLNGRALLARFRCRERQGEETPFRRFFEGLLQRGLLTDIHELPPGIYQEGAGDCIWDASRQMFWVGYGQRSVAESVDFIRDCFGQPLVALELATPHFYHLDTCFCPLPGGEVMYFPPALTKASQALIHDRVPADMQIIATEDEAAAFSLNAVALEHDLIMAPPPPRLRGLLEERGYRVSAVDLSPFMLSGGAAYCMTLRLDRRSAMPMQAAAE